MFQLFVYVCDFLCVLCWLRLVAYTGLYNSCLLVSSFLFFPRYFVQLLFVYTVFFTLCCCFIFPFSTNCNFKFIWQQKQNEFKNWISDLKNWSKLSTILMKMLKKKIIILLQNLILRLLIYNYIENNYAKICSNVNSFCVCR